MKRSRKFLSLLLSLVLCLNFAIPTFAADANSVYVSLSQNQLNVSDQAQTVTLSINTREEVSIDSLAYEVQCDSPLTYSDPVLPANVTGATSLNPVVWYYSGAMGSNVDGLTNLGTVTITIPANTPAGTYSVGITGFDASENADYWAEQQTYTTTLTIVGGQSGGNEGKSVSISASPTTVTAGEVVYVNVNVEGTYHACEIELSYNSNLTYNESKSTLNGASVEAANGTVTIVDSGNEKGSASAEYVIAFDASPSGTATVVVTSAGLGTNEEAETQDLKDAAFSNTPVSITVNKIRHNVTLPSIFKGVETVEDGATYTFRIADDGVNYNYTNVSATVNGDPVEVSGNSTDGWSVANVDGELVISGTRTEKTFSVEIDGETESNDGENATFNTDYVFTLKPNKDAGLEAGYTYALTSVTIGNQAFSDYIPNGTTYTIPGAYITGDIKIVITKTDVDPNKFTVTAAGNAMGWATNVLPATVNAGDNFTLTVTPEAGYTYTVTAEGYEVQSNGNNHTVTNITGNVVFMITKAIPVNNVKVDEYSGMGSGNTLWIITNTTAKLEGKTYQYNGQNMYWSDDYNAYVTFVVAETQPEVSSSDFSIVSGTATRTVTYDVNNTGHVDANDAQLVYNMYNTGYADFTQNVTLEKFMNADVNADGVVDVEDVVAIIDHILAQ